MAYFIVPYEWDLKSMGVLSKYVYEWVEPTGFVAGIIAILLLCFQAAILNFVVMEYRMANDITLFPGLFYILFCSLIPEFLYLSPVLLGNTFAIIALYQLMETYKKYSCADNIYNIGFWTGVASMFYFSNIIYLIIAWIGLNILRAFKLNERIILLTGFFSPYLLAFAYYYWNNQGAYFLESQILRNISFWDFAQTEHLVVYLSLGIFALLLLLVIFNARSYDMKKNIRVHKNHNILYVSIFALALTLLFQAQVGVEHLLLLCIAFGIFLSYNFSDMSSRVAESIHLILFTLVLFWQYFPLVSF